MDRTGANFDNAINDMRTKLAANAWPVLIPLGKEDFLKGQLDVVNKVAIIYNDNDVMGSTYQIEPIPAGGQSGGRSVDGHQQAVVGGLLRVVPVGGALTVDARFLQI
jgi:translation elongation factor EF-G